ncbi:MAG TPA: TonB-dependent receptor [Steroidobacteraceae bacterium]|nr:TonB-dependent receptor [Steroidobacteraceae bacterium]
MQRVQAASQRASMTLGFILSAASVGGPGLGEVRAQTSPATSAESGGLEEIIVTANKRAENIQQVPIAITAVTAERLENIGITNTQDLAQVVPGLTIQNSLSGTQAHLRGVGTTALSAGTENSVATYIDGVYIMSLSAALVQLNNIAQVEVLKGPQGTLFGRNATGGVINVRTRDPQQELGGQFGLRYGNYETVSAQAYVTGGISDAVSADVAGFISEQGKGWGENAFNGKDVNDMDQYAVRSKWLIEPTDQDQIRVIGDYSRLKGTAFDSFAPLKGTSVNYGPGTTLAGQRPDLLQYLGPTLAPFAVVGDPYTYTGGFYDTDTAKQPEYKYKNGGASVQWDHDFDALRLTSITAYRAADQRVGWSNVPVPAFRAEAEWHQEDHQFSQEIQLGSIAGANVPWVAGLYFLDGEAEYKSFDIRGTTLSPLDTLGFHSSNTTKAGAAFGQITVPVWSGGHLTGGLRYSIEKRGVEGDTVVTILPDFGGGTQVSPPVDDHKTFRKLTWRVAVDQQLTSDILGYVSYNRGFKSGLFNSIPPGGDPIKPEVLDAYEVGIKADLLDQRMRLNVAGFYYDYKNLQVTVFSPTSALLDNGAGAELYGADMDFTAKIGSNVTLYGGAAVLHSEFTSYPDAGFHTLQPASAGGGAVKVTGSAKGNRLPYAPDFTANIGGEYVQPIGEGQLSLNLNYSYSDKWFAGPGNTLHQSSYGLFDAAATYTFAGDRLEVGIWGRNLTKEKYYVFLAEQANPGGYFQGLVGTPRTYGGMIGYKF